MNQFLWLVRKDSQGLGLRPKSFRMASSLGLVGTIGNSPSGMFLQLWGSPQSLNQFQTRWTQAFPHLKESILELKSPSNSPPKELTFSDQVPLPENWPLPESFSLQADCAICPECLLELFNPHKRRFHYPLIACSDCGPRFPVLKQLPFSRKNTTWDLFPPCPECIQEYQDPNNRRFHQQNISCPKCGPKYVLHTKDHIPQILTMDLLQTIARSLKSGAILCLQGFGGFHLLADPVQATSVQTLKKLKQRPFQPMALLMPNLEAILELANLSEAEIQSIQQAANPIQIARQLTKKGAHLSKSLFPKHQGSLGFLLPPNGLLALLTSVSSTPLLFTSANVHQQPNPVHLEELSTDIRDHCQVLTHSLPVLRSMEDSVLQQTPKGPRIIRRSRGLSPLTMQNPFPLKEPTLALGGDLQNTLAFGFEHQIVLSQHLGDHQSPLVRERSLEFIQHMSTHLGRPVERVLMDAHPGFFSSELANHFPKSKQQKLFHHRAHAAQVLADFQGPAKSILIATFDGTGYGEDHRPWGGELFFGPTQQPQYLKRVGSLNHTPSAPYSIGRLFDHAAILLGLGERNTFEGDLPMRLMALALTEKSHQELPNFKLDRQGDLLLWDCDSFLKNLETDLQKGAPLPTLALRVHLAVIVFILQVARTWKPEVIGLSGGCFYNVLLLELLEHHVSVPLMIPQSLPCGDGGLAVGQLVLQAAVDMEEAAKCV